MIIIISLIATRCNLDNMDFSNIFYFDNLKLIEYDNASHSCIEIIDMELPRISNISYNTCKH